MDDRHRPFFQVDVVVAPAHGMARMDAWMKLESILVQRGLILFGWVRGRGCWVGFWVRFRFVASCVVRQTTLLSSATNV